MEKGSLRFILTFTYTYTNASLNYLCNFLLSAELGLVHCAGNACLHFLFLKYTCLCA